MRRWVGWAVASLVLAASLLAAGTTSASAASIGPTICSGTVQITSFAFVPPSVAPGGSSAATLNARNCTGQTLQTTTTWFGRFIGSTVGIPSGCPAIDPLPRPVTFAPHRSISISTTYLTFPSCTATALQITVRIAGATGTLLATATATLTIVQP